MPKHENGEVQGMWPLAFPSTPWPRETAHRIIKKGQKSLLVTAIFAGIVLAGAILRISNLDGPAFGGDEIFHIFVAKQLMEGNPPMLPSGRLYTRDLLYTKLVAYTGSRFGLTERTARLPSILFGLSTIAMVFLMTCKWYSTSAGLTAAFLTALAPMQIAYSRQVRSYAMFQFLYLASIFLFFQAFETSPRRSHKRWIPRVLKDRCRSLEIDPVLLIVAVSIVFVTVNVNRLIVPALSGIFLYVICMAILAMSYHEMSAPVRLKYLASGICIIVAVLGSYLYFDNVTNQYIALVRYAPTWAEGSRYYWLYYRDMLATGYPIVFGSFGLASIFALTRNPKATLFLVSCFGLPFLMQSLVFAWKIDRFVLHIIPLMFIIAGVGGAALISFLYPTLTAWGENVLRPFTSRVVGVILIAIASLSLLGSVPWFMQGIKIHRLNEGKFGGVRHNDWKRAMQFIADHHRYGDVIVTSLPLLAKYYGPDLAVYLLNDNELERTLHNNLRDEKGRLIEYTAGARVITDLKSLQELVSEHRSGWFVAERFRFYESPFIPKDIRLFIEETFYPEDILSARDMVIWRWGQGAKVARSEPGRVGRDR